MKRPRLLVQAELVASLLLVLCMAASAVQIQPALLEVTQSPSTENRYTLTIHNDSSSTEQLVFYLADWKRLEDGQHDWNIPVNGARWVFDRPLLAGEATVIRYAVKLQQDALLSVQGVFGSQMPSMTGAIMGDRVIGGHMSTLPAPVSAEGIVIHRTIESIDPSGLATVALHILSDTVIEGLAVYEVLERRAEITSLDAAGSHFDTVNRSSADWTTIPLDKLSLAPGETKELSIAVHTPPDTAGTYWSAIVAELRPQESSRDGAQIFTIMRTAIKILVTVPGTEIYTGEIARVDVPQTNPLAVSFDFVNTGNTELSASGEIHVIDREGDTIQVLAVDEFRTLPLAHRTVTLFAPAGAVPLSPGIYQAVASVDLGSALSVVGVRAFRVR